MTLDSIEYVTNFPHSYKLENSNDVNIENIGVMGCDNFNIVDSLVIFSTNDGDGFWSFVSLPDNNFINKFLKRGQGPDEFLFSPSVQTATNFFKDNGKQYAAIYDSQKGKVYKMNIDESVKSKKLAISIMKDSVSLFLMNFVMIDSNRFLYKALSATHTQQLRYIMKNNIRESCPNFEKLNKATVNITSGPAYYFNIISTLTKYNKERNLIVEMPVMLNYLNLYSIDGSFGKTICIGNKLSNIEEIQIQKYPDLVETFFDLRIYKDFWGVVFVDENELTLQTKREKLPSLFLFNWQGEPLAELKLNRQLTSFDIDFNSGILYGLDNITDTFFKYDINQILKDLRLNRND